MLNSMGLAEGWAYLVLALGCSAVFTVNSRQGAAVNSPSAAFELAIALLVLLAMIVKAILSNWWVELAVSILALLVEVWLVTRWWLSREST
ncbi:MAG: hypothetical protein KGL75_08300 [Acidobacteriota bacterium]|nr:hypothetical protein [Acidobacteriota bacterium]